MISRMADHVHPSSPPLGVHPRRRFAVQGKRFALLFFFLLFSIIVYPYAESSTYGYYAFRIVSSAIVVLTIYAVAFRRGLVLLVLVLAVPAFLHHTLLTPITSGTPALIGRLLSLAFDLIVVIIIFRCVYTEKNPDSETIFGALCIYLLIGYGFASIYGLILSLQSNAFYLDPTVNQHTAPDRFDLIYYSFGTLTELGTPGITALSREVRSISLLEAVLGILYLAVLISRIMSAYRSVTVALQIPKTPPGKNLGEPSL